MQKVIGVRLKKAGRIHYFKPGNAEIQAGDTVIVETSRGLEGAAVVISPREIANDKVSIPSIYRKATPNDLAKLADNKAREQEAFNICLQKIADHKLPMKLINVEYTFDVNKIIFSFTADGRVDFRELVKDLAAIFRTRIELRQVGVRDEAKLMGGVGGCGRPLCCATFLGDFVPVSIRMAKEQNLSLNPTKISGICGRLMCCLKYENDYYCEKYKNLVPDSSNKTFKLGDRVIVDDGEGKVISISELRKTATIMLDNSQTVIAPWSDIFAAETTVEEGQIITVSTGKVVNDEEVKVESPAPPQTPMPEKNFDSYPRRSSKKTLPPVKNQSRNQNSRSNNYKSVKRGRRNEDYRQDKKFHPRRRNVNEHDE